MPRQARRIAKPRNPPVRCKKCDYPLWNLRSRSCPECGAAFKPSDFVFVPNTVKFLCPHCGQTYFGTGTNGHLVPSHFNCVTCTQPIDMDSMLVLPADGVAEKSTTPLTIPWTDGKRDGVGVFKRWIRTIGLVVGVPMRVGRAITPSHGVTSPLMFSLATTAFVAIIGAVAWLAILVLLPGSVLFVFGGRHSGGPSLVDVLKFFAYFFGFIAGLIVAMQVMVLLWALSAHAILRMTGKTHAGLRGTLASMYFASGASIFYLVPCIGMYGLAQIWSIISGTCILHASQRVGGFRAACATLAFPLLIVAAFASGYSWLVWTSTQYTPSSYTSSTPIAPGSPASVQFETRLLVAAMKTYAVINHRSYPKHALDLAAGPTALFDPQKFVADAMSVVGCPSGAPGITLDAFIASDLHGRRVIADAAAAALPPDVLAHRVGDYIFTYHGINPSRSGSVGGTDQLWIVVFVPDPSAANNPTLTGAVVVGLVDGSVQGIGLTDWPMAVQRQNALRASFGLALLPEDMSTITPSTPLTASTQPAAPSSPPPYSPPSSPSQPIGSPTNGQP